MSDVIMRQNDRRPYMNFVLSDANGVVDLTNETVTLTAKSSAGAIKMKGSTNPSSSEGTITITNSTAGAGRYQWHADDCDTPATFLAEFETENLAGEIATYPNNGHIEILIKPEIST